MRLLVLYEELAWYFINCMNTVAETHDAHVLIICKSPNQSAPFSFSYVHPNIRIERREQYTQQQLETMVRDHKPDGVFVGGWAHKPYLELIRKLQPLRTVIGFDNQWTGSIKQRLGALYFRLFIKKIMHFAFVPGRAQHLFATHLGFDDAHIREGAYCCDHALFSQFEKKYHEQKAKQFPKRFLYVGRYAPEKGISDLWHSFIQWQKETPNEWELWCLGKGELAGPVHEKIRHFGFVQPEEMGDIIAQTGVFVLPSNFEPWGVVVHEYAAAGFPLLCADKVGASETFVEDGRNGYLFTAGRREQLKEKMNTFSSLKQDQLSAMAAHSVKLAQRITPQAWASTLMGMYTI